MVAKTNGILLSFLESADEEQFHTLLRRELEYYSTTSKSSSLAPIMKPNPQAAKWRPKIIEWFYKIVDYFEYNRDAVAIALDLLDRFHILSSEEVNGEKYQLIAMTSLYVAIKMNPSAVPNSSGAGKRRSFSICDFAKLSRGQFTAEDLVSMELDLLKTLNWKVNPVIPTDYLVDLLSLLSYDGEIQARHKYLIREVDLQRTVTIVYEVARYLIEISITSPKVHFYLNKNSNDETMKSPSLLCLGAIAQTLDWISCHHLPIHLKRKFIARSCSLLKVDNQAIENVKHLIKTNLIPNYLLEGNESRETIQEEVNNIYPFILLRDAKVLCIFAHESFMTSMLPLNSRNVIRKRKQPCSPTSILDNENIQ